VVKQAIELELSGFAGAALETEAERRSLTREELLSLGAEYYLAQTGCSGAARRVPQWLDELERGDTVTVTLELRLETWEQLAAQAHSDRTTVERVLEHATLTLIGDLDAGRVTARIVGD